MFACNVALWQRSIRIGAEMLRDAAARVPVTICLTLFATALAASPDATTAAQFDRAAIQSGQLWRVSTGHFVHWSVDHLVWDLAAFFVLAAYCESRSRGRLITAIWISSLAIAAGLWWLRPDLQYYRGLSGLDSALFVLAAATYGSAARRGGDRPASLAAVGAVVAFLGKVGYESLTGATLFVDSAAAGFEPLPLAHLLGAVGAAATLVLRPDRDR